MTSVRDWVELGERVRQARIAADLTQSALAGALGIDRSALVRIEGGGRQVSALELFALADALKLPIGHFVTASPVAVSSHRQDLTDDADRVSRETSKLDAHLEAHARDAEWLLLSGFLNRPTPLRLAIEGQADLGSDATALEAAREIRQHLGLAGPLGSMADVLAKAGLFALVADVAGGASLIVDDGVGVAVVGGRDEPGRRRMTAAHELGHFVLQDEYRTDIGVAASRDEREQRIELFAAEFLLPSAEVDAFLADHRGGSERTLLIRMASEYRVSWTVVVRAARAARFVTGSLAAQLTSSRPTKGELLEVMGRTPHEDLQLGETAAVWRQAAIAAWRSGAITMSRVAELTHGAVGDDDLPDRPDWPDPGVR